MAMVSPCLFASGGGTHWVTCGTGDSGASPRQREADRQAEGNKELPTAADPRCKNHIQTLRTSLISRGAPPPDARSDGPGVPPATEQGKGSKNVTARPPDPRLYIGRASSHVLQAQLLLPFSHSSSAASSPFQETRIDGSSRHGQPPASFVVRQERLGAGRAAFSASLPPPRRSPWPNAYLVAISGAFFAGMAKVCGHVAGNGSKLVTIYVSLVVVAAGLTALAAQGSRLQLSWLSARP
ncbi:hypothetical protein HU200_006928 [Digitaria exilis]|uniref:Uncharacterized protein n=1 Tax=Digitaria exilis TaxID=1010633 RepID=A0A835KQ82_9POAL|nr:hypothetical protein HU200_006928 [Digitaria exilis]